MFVCLYIQLGLADQAHRKTSWPFFAEISMTLLSGPGSTVILLIASISHVSDLSAKWGQLIILQAGHNCFDGWWLASTYQKYFIEPLLNTTSHPGQPDGPSNPWQTIR